MTDPSVSEPSPDAPVYPTPFQRKMVWSGLAAFFVVLMGAIAVGGVLLVSYSLGFLQPILVPVAVAGILAYLLEPIVLWLTRRKNGLDRKRSVLVVFLGFNLLAVLLAVLVLRPTIGEGRRFWSEEVATGELKTDFSRFVDAKSNLLEERFSTLPFYAKAEDWLRGGDAVTWLSEKLGQFSQQIGRFLGRGFTGATAALGYLLGLLLVPVYLYFFLKESTAIAHNWSQYVPLQESWFKDEVVGTLKEINGYLIAFFRGQMLVSMIDGVLVAIGLYLIGLPYALLIGVFVAILGLIPFIGNLLCLVPAVLISIAHFGKTVTVPLRAGSESPQVGAALDTVVGGEKVDGFVSAIAADGSTADLLVHTWSFLPTQVWAYPLVVIGLFFVLQQINGLVTAPKIVGDSVGLHPVTVIFSMLFWSLLLGGLLGALLAVPLTASVKVLFQRYIWKKRIDPKLQRLGERSEAKERRRDGPTASSGNEGTKPGEPDLETDQDTAEPA